MKKWLPVAIKNTLLLYYPHDFLLPYKTKIFTKEDNYEREDTECEEWMTTEEFMGRIVHRGRYCSEKRWLC
jgi:hypothetical protein